MIGAGSWQLSAGGQELRANLGSAGTGMGAEVLNPPLETIRVAVEPGDTIVGTMTLRSGGTLGGAALLGLIARRAAETRTIITEAVAVAEAADVAVVVVGLTDEQETEAVDKSTLRLPGRQDELVQAVAAAARKTVVVVNAATPVLMPWIDQVDAVLWAGLPGQEGGHAVAAALLGTIEPAGRLVTTFPFEDGATPAWSVTPVDGEVTYAEDTFIGYRGHYAQRAPAPVFWFGHGLGYSTWRIQPQLSTETATCSVALTVTNTGARPSREVVQVYFEPVDAGQPIRLVGWRSLDAAAGESVDVSVTSIVGSGVAGRLAPTPGPPCRTTAV